MRLYLKAVIDGQLWMEAGNLSQSEIVFGKNSIDTLRFQQMVAQSDV